MIVECCRRLDEYASDCGVRLLYEPCNRYEVAMIHTAAEAEALLAEIGSDNIGVLLDSFHMNIEESDPCAALRRLAGRNGIYHISDSGRGGMGTGHIDYIAQHRALQEGGFNGPVAVELVLPHLAPTGLPRNAREQQMLDEQIRHSARIWRALESDA
ncbi:TIM barrel protein [Kushneria phosphatilytica]|nr:TIM barrel protein [Kushneria phosphatilytica]OHV08910.1 hypothetical protein BH688_12975 [Kushneria phosphatilytica]